MKIKHGEKMVVLKETSNDRFKGNYRVKGEDAVNSFCLLGSIIKNKRPCSQELQGDGHLAEQ